MNLFNGQGNGILNTVANNVRAFVSGKPAEPVPSDAHNSDNTNSPQRTTRSATLQYRQMNSEAGTFKWKTKSVNKLLKGSYDEGIEISDDDHEPIKVSQSQTKKENIPKSPSLRASTRKSVISINKSDNSRACVEEIRLLGDWEPSPDDAVRVEVPSRKQEMPFTQVRSPFMGGLRPVDTLNEQRAARSSRTDFMLNQTRGGDSSLTRRTALRGLSPVKDQRKFENADDIDNRPTKRLRMSGSSKDSQPLKTATIILDGPNESRDEATSSTRSEMQDKFGYEPSQAELSTARQARVRDTPLRRMDKQSADAARQLRPSRQSPSPDPLFDPPGEMFMKIARAQRVRDQEDANSPSGKRQRPGSVVTVHSHPNSRSNEPRINSSSSSRKAAPATTPSTSKMDDRLREAGDSPDVLQAGFHTVRKASKSRVEPLSPTDYTEQPGRPFNLKTFVASGSLAKKDCRLEVKEVDKTFSIRYKSEGSPNGALIPDISISKIGSLGIPDTEKNNIVFVRLSAGAFPENKCFLDFSSQKEYVDFCKLVLGMDAGIKTQHQPCTMLESSMAKAWARTRDMPQEEREVSSIDCQGHAHIRSPSYENKQPVRRIRKVDQLDAPPLKPAELDLHGMASKSEHDDASPKSRTTSARSNAMDSTRQTRSVVKQNNRQKSVTPPSKTKAPARRRGIPWAIPLTYPLTGKGKETVTWEELERLEDDQFLNDSLVSLFLKYLQKHSNPEWLKTMHYFSTFFYENLTRPIEGKGSRQRINYQGVASWTKNNNIFQRDYVIVPVNENYHWYVMIICNLRRFWDWHHGTLEEDDAETTTRVKPLVELPDESSKQILGSDILPASESAKEKASDEEEEGTSTGEKKTLKKKKSHRVTGQKKFDVNEPVIITLDSLNVGRSGTAGFLKDYIIKEAEVKWGMTISKEEIPNMTAKAIPLQSNFSDCGLYMCMYLEQFMKDPNTFKQSLLRREAELIKWPREIESGLLRQRLYDMLQELHDAQVEKKKEAEVPELGSILIRKEDFRRRADTSRTGLLGMAYEELNDRLGWLDRHTEERDKKTTTSTQALSEYRHDFIDVEDDDNSPGTRSTSQTTMNAHEPVGIEDESQDVVEITGPESNVHHQERYQEPAQTTSRHFPVSLEDEDRSPLQPILLDPPHATQQLRDSPEKLARRLAAERSPQGDTLSSSTVVAAETQHNVEVSRQERSLSQASVTTDYLIGNGSYIDSVARQQAHERLEPNRPSETEWNGFADDVQYLGQIRRHSQDDMEQKEVVIAESIYGDEEDASRGTTTEMEHTDMLMTD